MALLERVAFVESGHNEREYCLSYDSIVCKTILPNCPKDPESTHYQRYMQKNPVQYTICTMYKYSNHR